MKLKPRFWGSAAALVFGALAVFAGFANPQSSTLIAGLIMLIGSLAYRSAKKTSLRIVGKSTARQVAELLGIAAILAIVGLQRDLLDLMYSDPVPNLIIPVWALVAYVVAKTGRAEAVPAATA